MPAIIETTELISKTMDSLIDFIVKDEPLGREFENYLIKNKIEIKKESELNDILIDYILEGKMETGKRVLDYFIEKTPNADKKTVEALKESYVSVFRTEKISKNSFDVYDLAKETNYTLIPLVKTTNLRGIGLYDFMKARVFELDNNFYLLEIFDVFGQFREYFANLESVKCIIKNPKIAVLNNKEKLLEIKKSNLSFHSSFVECFNCDEIIVSNKDIDNILNDFYLYHTGAKNKKVEFRAFDGDFEFFEVEEFENENFMQNALYGFSNSEKNYDIGLFSNQNEGIFVIPFLGTLNSILKNENVKNKSECIKYFLINDKIPPSLLIKKEEEFKNFVSTVNETTGGNFQNIDEIIDTYKENYKDHLRFSSVSVLYNSKAFSKVLNKKEENENKFKNIGRNDPCPCGSGKKFKKCCMLKEGI